MIQYNFGCGHNKLEGFINVDVEPSVEPDEVMDFLKPLPIETGTVDRIVFFHVIEHIHESHHPNLLLEFHRILRDGGEIFIAYPEFAKIAHNWLDNYKGHRTHWKHCIYGLQRYPSDYHVSLMSSDEFKELLTRCGFENLRFKEEAQAPWNTVVKGTKGIIQPSYEDVLRQEIFADLRV